MEERDIGFVAFVLSRFHFGCTHCQREKRNGALSSTSARAPLIAKRSDKIEFSLNFKLLK